MESYGCRIVINISKLNTLAGCEELLLTSTKHGKIGSIFNYAEISSDGTNGISPIFSDCFSSNVCPTQYLDTLCRKMCPELEHFVIFSYSIHSSVGADRLTYGMKNAIINRIIEQRNRNELPGKAITWGKIDDFDTLSKRSESENKRDVKHILPQRIDRCLFGLDKLLINDGPFVVSMQVANSKEIARKLDVVESVCNILGFDQKSISPTLTLAQLGLDSLMIVEVKLMLESQFDLILDNNTIQNLTISQLRDRKNLK